MGEPVTILILEDDPAFAEVLGKLLPEAVHQPVRLQHVTEVKEALNALRRERFDVILLDLNVPDSTGGATLSQVLPHAGGTPVVVIASIVDEALAIHAVREGAQDFVVKAEVDRRMLGRVIRYAIERKRAVEVLHHTLADLKKAHEELKAAQLQAIQSEKLEAVSTFAAGVAHEVKNPLQTIILGVDYLSNHLKSEDQTAASVLTDMAEAVSRADAIIRGLIEFSADNKPTVKEEDLTAIVEQALHAVRVELGNCPIRLTVDLTENLPLRADLRSMKHVFINLLMYCVRGMHEGGALTVRTLSRDPGEALSPGGKTLPHFKAGETVVMAEIEDTANHLPAEQVRPAGAGKDLSGLGLTVLKKIIELYGGVIHIEERREGSRFTIAFKEAKA
jgi:two-component system, NtrC family, sensor kinase